jgi:hypothetical protein
MTTPAPTTRRQIFACNQAAPTLPGGRALFQPIGVKSGRAWLFVRVVDNSAAVDSRGRLSGFAGMLRDFGRPERVYSANRDSERIIVPDRVILGDGCGASTNDGGASTDSTRAAKEFVFPATEFGPAPIEFDLPPIEFGPPAVEFDPPPAESGSPTVESGH